MPAEFETPSLAGDAEAICRREGALGVVVVAFYAGSTYTTAWAGATDDHSRAMARFAEHVETAIIPESPRDRDEVGPGGDEIAWRNAEPESGE